MTSKRTTVAIDRAYTTADLHVITVTQGIPIPSLKTLPTVHATPHCLYQFVCSCGAGYLGRTDRRLVDRMDEHIPKYIRTGSINSQRKPSSSIGKHLLETGYTPVIEQAFTLFLKCQNARTLRFAEALAIKTLDPIFCVQKIVFCTLKMPWT